LDDGDVDIGMASRKIKPEEVSKLSRFGDMTSPANERVLGLDGIAVLVNPANSVSCLTIDQVAAIFSGVVTDWRQVGGAAGPIHVYARDDKSGTYDTFKALVLNKTPLISTAQRIEDSSELSGKVAADPGGIGFVGLGAIGAAKPLAVSANGAAPLVPNRFTVATEDYVLSRRLFLYVTKAADQPDVLRFLEFANSPKGQAIVDEVGFVPLTIVQQKTVAPTSAPPEYEALTTGALRLSVNFRFNSGSSNLDNRALADLDRITAFLASSGVSPDRLVLVGFADSRGSGPVNQRLSEQRAQTVATMLAQRGISPGTIRGFGAALPVADNSTPDGREKNRRVEAWIRH
jgi:phosphate transport system substrate-binding protein